MKIDDTHEMMRVMEGIIQNDPDLGGEEQREDLSWDEICKMAEDSLRNDMKCKDDVHPDNPKVKIHNGQP